MSSASTTSQMVPYIDQFAVNGNITADIQGSLLSEQPEPPIKRARTSNSPPLNKVPSSVSINHPKLPEDVNATSYQPIMSNGVQGINGSIRDSYASGGSSTPQESTTSTSFTSSFGTKKSTSPPTTPAKSRSTPPYPSGLNLADSSKVDFSKCRPRSSIPSRLSPAVYGQQCVAAGYASRLDPYALHRKEQDALQDHLCHLQVTLYLNIRNGILRLWTRNPMVSVTREEALGCAKDYRWMNLASFAYDWLVRNGYINFGCVEAPIPQVPPKRGRRKEGPVIVVVGAGVAGLGCARQLESLFRHYRDADTAPRVVLLEGRRRIGGRIYSHPLHSLQSADLPSGLVPKAEMGAQIIVGFDQGNPLDQIVRGQLALSYHFLRDISTIYDIDGSPVDEVRDSMDEKLYNDVLDRAGFYRHNAVIVPTAEGDRDMIDTGRESTVNDGLTVRQYEDARAAGTIDLLVPKKRVRRGVGHKTADIKPSGDTDLVGPSKEHPAALACQSMGWKLNPGYTVNNTLELETLAKESPVQTLGAIMDEGVKQYQRMLPLTPRDMRLLNWHFANLEYANATNVDRLSLTGWDQDIGNEFEGEHSQVVGGYSQLPYGLYSLPTQLDVRTGKIVSNISYNAVGSGNRKAMVQCEDGEKFMADHVVFTGSLGILKQQSITFNPPLPDWKSGAIDRLGFGVMNKVILVFDQPFWDTDRDMFGLLREPENPNSMVQEEYAANRGRFYLFWNCVPTTGLPVLIALMAGDAAHQAERTSDAEIIGEVTSQLRNVFKHATVPDPLETIITRWGSDRFTRGSYSYVAAAALPEDYDLMARQIGNLHFAGEATCGTHPATVHGAYLSGLRAASERIDNTQRHHHAGVPKEKGFKHHPLHNANNHNNPPARQHNPKSTEKSKEEAYTQAFWTEIYAELGPAPPRPPKAGLNPFLLYQKDYWTTCREQCDEARRTATKNTNARAARDEIRHALGQMWRNAPADIKAPYLAQTEANRRANTEAWEKWKVEVTEWERLTYVVKDRWCAANPFETWQAGTGVSGDAAAGAQSNGVSHTS
ncbi:Winged helix-turn-helix transcription repressor DNA-binding [Penicillium riverlandense]|uniref:Winged helix-turn-helix transcription repressor DNA-binding n=1 Tax=Penicillium riverlandense TaxID=1903569 RepID=UPI00254704BB|nr:Winged helix-turn-helix transcription repressor DNA-binding [Penicillium riverlandense]KAJ5814855.1 Winged helix-turn-helix transcription repressor DNA-binding [Penicillium riverlandense]